jgi:hypothetical protein
MDHRVRRHDQVRVLVDRDGVHVRGGRIHVRSSDQYGQIDRGNESTPATLDDGPRFDFVTGEETRAVDRRATEDRPVVGPKRS